MFKMRGKIKIKKEFTTMNSNKFKMTIGMAIIACVATWCYSNTKQEVSGVNEMVWPI